MSTVFGSVFDNGKEIMQIPVNLIRSNPYQPRKVFDKELLLELADSIKEYGIMQPISVRRNGDKYELVAGERRLRAAKLAGRETIPSILIEISERDSAFLALMENLQRENLNFLEEAEGYLNLMQDYGLTQEEVAVKLGKSQSNIANKVRLLKLPDEIKNIIREHGLTERHGRALLKLPDKQTQISVLKKIVEVGMNVRNTDAYIEKLLQKPASKSNSKKSKNARFYIKDPKIFTNTIKNAVDLINKSGGSASYSLMETEETVEVIVSIQKRIER